MDASWKHNLNGINQIYKLKYHTIPLIGVRQSITKGQNKIMIKEYKEIDLLLLGRCQREWGWGKHQRKEDIKKFEPCHVNSPNTMIQTLYVTNMN